MRRKDPWAWWLFALSGAAGFLSFLAYLGYGYLDSWHGLATVALLPCFGLGLVRSARDFALPGMSAALRQPGERVRWLSTYGLGKACLLGTALGLIGGGAVILGVGTTSVFVPEDLAYMGLEVEELHAFNPRLVPLIAHDRAGFGGCVCTCGIVIFFCVWCGTPSRPLWLALCLAGVAGFVPAIAVHFIVGYDNLFHLAPAVTGCVIYTLGLLLTRAR